MLTKYMNSIKRCFCGSESNFSSCCQPYINQELPVKTAEQLMRSRFSAYADGNAQYIYDTYAKSSQKAQSLKELDEWSKSCVWLALKIHPVTNNANISTEQYVEFSAFYITNNTLCELREKSRFVLEESTLGEQGVLEKGTDKATLNHAITPSTKLRQWRYIDGDIIAHSELATIKRNELCPCNHYPTAWQPKKGKKFKHCCGR